MSARLAKIAVAAAAGALLALVALDNLLDYGTNFEVVQHILSMDMFPESPLKWRAVTSPALHQLCYAFIIAVECLSAAATLFGALALWRARAAAPAEFERRKAFAIAGLCAGLLLYLFGFMAVGGEWFQIDRKSVV
jgi:predicted small integral membrane protein